MDPEEKSRIILFRGWKDTGCYVWSPFVTKVELRFRLASLPYRVEEGKLSESPKGKIPHIAIAKPRTDGPTRLSDSSLIISRLVDDGELPEINAALEPIEAAFDLALRATLEEKLYFYHTRERWVENYYAMRDHILQALPYPVRVFVGLLIYRKTTATLHGQGTGRLSKEEMAQFRLEIWQSFDALLGEARKGQSDEQKPFWVMGKGDPTEADCALFSFITSVLICHAAPDSRKVVGSFHNLSEYVRRIHEVYFPDYASPFENT
ncbi:MAG: glutathione S-transferase family protein [Terriglobus roseus]|nr:glutathione S-transferase family protein [Terriglobus roseus]